MRAPATAATRKPTLTPTAADEARTGQSHGRIRSHEPPDRPHPHRARAAGDRDLLAGRARRRHRVSVRPGAARPGNHAAGERRHRSADPPRVRQSEGRGGSGRRLARPGGQDECLSHRPRALRQGERDHGELLRQALPGARGGRRRGAAAWCAGRDRVRPAPSLSPRPGPEGRPSTAERAEHRPVTSLRGVGAALAERLARLSVRRVSDLLFVLPRLYEGRTQPTAIGSLGAARLAAGSLRPAAGPAVAQGSARLPSPPAARGAPRRARRRPPPGTAAPGLRGAARAPPRLEAPQALAQVRRGLAAPRRPGTRTALPRGVAFQAHPGPGPRARRCARGSHRGHAHGAAAAGRCRLRQDGRGGRGRGARGGRGRTGGPHGADRAPRRAALAQLPRLVLAARRDGRAALGRHARAHAAQRAGGDRFRGSPRGDRHARALPGRHRVRAPRARHRRRAAPLRRAAAPQALGKRTERGARAAPADHDGDAHPAHPRHDRVRRPRHLGHRRAASGAHAGADGRGAGAAPGRGRGAHRRGLPRRAAGVLGLPADRRVGRAARTGGGGDRRAPHRGAARGARRSGARAHAGREEGQGDARLPGREDPAAHRHHGHRGGGRRAECDPHGDRQRRAARARAAASAARARRAGHGGEQLRAAVPRAALGPGARAAQGDPRDLGRLRDRAARPGAPRARGAPRHAPDGARAAACRRSHARRGSAARRAADGRTVAGCLPGARRRAHRPLGGGGRALRPGGLKAVGRGTLSSGAAIAVLSIIFFAWGGLTSLNDVLIPHLKAVFEMNYARTMLIQFTFFSTYLVMSIPAGRVVAHLGFKPCLVVGLIVAATGALAFYPAATVPSYPLFLLALFVLASGITLLQVSANPYISLIGEPRGASSRLTLAQAVNSLGHTLSPWLIGPLILSVAVLSGAALAQLPPPQQEAYRIAQAQSVRLPYLGIAAGLLALASLVYLLRLPPLTEATERADPRHHSFGEVLRQRHVRLGVVAIFVYVGAEVTIGSL